MSNSNSVADVILRQNNGQPIAMQVLGPQHAAFLLNGTAAVLSLPNPLAGIDTVLPFINRAAVSIPFICRAAGLISTTARGQQVQIDINQGIGLSPAVATTALQTIPNGAGTYSDNWLLEIEGMWDPTSLNLRGIVYGYFGPNSVAQAALVGSSPAALANLQFNVAVTWPGATVGTTTLSLTEFSAEMV